MRLVQSKTGQRSKDFTIQVHKHVLQSRTFKTENAHFASRISAGCLGCRTFINAELGGDQLTRIYFSHGKTPHKTLNSYVERTMGAERAIPLFLCIFTFSYLFRRIFNLTGVENHLRNKRKKIIQKENSRTYRKRPKFGEFYFCRKSLERLQRF